MSSIPIPEPGCPQYLIVVRHGESELNQILKSGESVDGLVDETLKLTDLGHAQAEAVGVWLDTKLRELGVSLDYCFSSPYVRTQETAADIVGKLSSHPGIVTDELLREKNMGIVFGLSTADQYKKFPLDRALYNLNPFFHSPPGGDSMADVGVRVWKFLEKMYSEYSGKNILVVTHQVPQKLFRKHIENLTEAATMELTAPNCAVTIYKCNSGQPPALCLNEYIAQVPGMPK
jgi:broad specificity phosphatase PhoE